MLYTNGTEYSELADHLPISYYVILKTSVVTE